MADEEEDSEDFDEFFASYIEAALWSSNDENGVPLDRDHNKEDIDEELLEEMKDDARFFWKENKDYIQKGGTASRAGHDFWLTRNGHGAGFWDGDWPDRIATRLTLSSQSYGEVNLYVGDDGKIYAM